jgi:hypothetical protein
MKTNASTMEQRCPACSGLFTISSGPRKKKVQCPRCRALVTLSEAGEVNGTPEAEAASRSPAPEEWAARCEQLQVRIETLEQQVETLLVTPRTQSPLMPGNFQNSSAKSRNHRLLDDPARIRNSSGRANGGGRGEDHPAGTPAGEAARRDKYEQSLKWPTLDIALLVNAGDAEARRLAESLKETLSVSGWKVRGVSEDAAAAQGCSGVTLAASPTIPLPMVTGTLDALSAVGLAVTLQFDPERGTNESLLIVGAAPQAEEVLMAGAPPPADAGAGADANADDDDDADETRAAAC